MESSSSSYSNIDSQQAKDEAAATAQSAEQKTSEAADEASQKGSEASKDLEKKAREAKDYTSQKSSELADKAGTNYDKAKGATKDNAKKAEREIKSEYNDVYENRDNPVVIANAVAIVLGAAGLAYGGYQKHIKGELDWQIAGAAAAAVAVLGVGDYYLSQ